MFYDGHPQMEPGAVVCRVAPSFLRFGNFELPASREEREVLERLVDFCIDRDFPELSGGDTAERRAHWFAAVAERTAIMVAHWLRVGFVHGVMNTDNMSILGLTIDYGPYGWIDDYDPDGALENAQEFLRRSKARGGHYGSLGANQDAGSTLNNAFRLRGLNAWGRYYGDAVFDPFAGSGSTGCAALLEGRQFMGIERDGDYIEIARARLEHWAEQDEGPA